ncbi:hypothetical protein OAK95_02590 [Akkermansiaceae bacterium]|nr:hypothetical protein [Akkermansiaceae bacterium]
MGNDVEAFEQQGCRIIVAAGCSGVPVRTLRPIARRDPDAIQIGDESIIVFHVERQPDEPRGIRDLEGNANVGAGINTGHLRAHVAVGSKQRLIAARVLVTNSRRRRRP